MKAQPLAGIRVLEVGGYISAPYAGVILGALGAEVIKVEPHEGEAFRRGRTTEMLFLFSTTVARRASRSILRAIAVLSW